MQCKTQRQCLSVQPRELLICLVVTFFVTSQARAARSRTTFGSLSGVPRGRAGRGGAPLTFLVTPTTRLRRLDGHGRGSPSRPARLILWPKIGRRGLVWRRARRAWEAL